LSVVRDQLSDSDLGWRFPGRVARTSTYHQDWVPHVWILGPGKARTQQIDILPYLDFETEVSGRFHPLDGEAQAHGFEDSGETA
jgi:hypothetical protein